MASLGWLTDINDLCLENDIELILINTPNSNQIALPIDDGDGFIETDGSGYYKALGEYAKDHDMTYINMNGVIDGSYHNGIKVSSIISSWFGRWYVANHQIEDKRGNEAFSEWNEYADFVYAQLYQ